MDIDLLGPLEVRDGVVLEPRDRIALSVLLVQRNRAVTSEQLADALWGEHPPSSWGKQVQICISRLRKAVGHDRPPCWSGIQARRTTPD